MIRNAATKYSAYSYMVVVSLMAFLTRRERQISSHEEFILQ